MARKYWATNNEKTVGRFTMTEERKRSSGQIRVRVKDDTSGAVFILSPLDILDLADLVDDKADELEDRGVLAE